MSGNRLPVLVNTETNQRIDITTKIVVLGRAPENEVVLPDDNYASGEHAKIFYDNGWFIEDMNSSNGTYVNNEMLTGRRKLAPNDLIMVGRTTFRIE